MPVMQRQPNEDSTALITPAPIRGRKANPMSLSALRDALPDYAFDQRQNLDALVAERTLTDQQKWGCFLACAYAAGSPSLIQAIESETADVIAPSVRKAAKAAAAIMAMNAIYYGAINLLQNHDYRSAPVNLSMTALSQPDVDRVDFELWAFAASALHANAANLNALEIELHKRGASVERVQAALRIAAVVNAVHTVLGIEASAG
jgi:alkyl hydroperoxide reductase subunit D